MLLGYNCSRVHLNIINGPHFQNNKKKKSQRNIGRVRAKTLIPFFNRKLSVEW